VSDFEGRITVESRPEEGTVFEVRLPRGKGAPE
jgi:signal transduction histidine kinase